MLNVFYGAGMLENNDMKYGAYLMGWMNFCPIESWLGTLPWASNTCLFFSRRATGHTCIAKNLGVWMFTMLFFVFSDL